MSRLITSRLAARLSTRRLSKGVAASALAFALAAGALTWIPAGDADAVPNYGRETIFYSDATKTQAVGVDELFCSGDHFVFGQTTAFSTTIYRPCH